ncbi:MAG: exodeoxyribonuclease VII small subunit [Clostridia bacterium]|nr:exodeoxyribonuclease VII small subunit [Clostridia bacterium]
MKKKFTFEEGMEALEKLVNRMESGNLPLEESFQAYRDGVEMYKSLRAMLDEGDAKIKEITLAGDKDITGEVTEE